MTIYLAGKITGDPGYREKFAAAKEWLLAEKEMKEVARGMLRLRDLCQSRSGSGVDPAV